jgi:hypothetical protein
VKRRTTMLFLVSTLVLMVQPGCIFISWFEALSCTSMGGTWYAEGPEGAMCEKMQNQPLASTPATAENECMASKEAYAWSYEGYRKSSGTGGILCNAGFVFMNNSNEPLYLISYEGWDNNAIQQSGWQKYQVQTHGTLELKVSKTFYFDGVVTFSRLERFLVIRDVPACANLLFDENRSVWDAQAVNIDEIPCP